MSAVRDQGSKVISDGELRIMLLQYRAENWRGIQTAEQQQRVVEDILSARGDEVLLRIAHFWPLPSNAQILDIGSGVGSFVVACRQRGLQAFGIEPDRIGQDGGLTAIQIASRRLAERPFVAGVGEHLPFPDRIFDLVVMNQVIEHVSDQLAVLREATRVLKQRGAVYLACPNYLRFYEPHYKIMWFPLLPKSLGRLYLQTRGRSPVMLNQLTYTTNRRLRRMIEELGSGYLLIDMNREQFLTKASKGSFASIPARLVQRLIRLPVIGKLVLAVVLLFLQLREGGSEMLLISQSDGR